MLLSAISGYITLPSGVMIQWKRVTGSGSWVNTTVTYPIAFSSKCLFAFAFAYSPGEAEHWDDYFGWPYDITLQNVSTQINFDKEREYCMFALGY